MPNGINFTIIMGPQLQFTISLLKLHDQLKTVIFPEQKSSVKSIQVSALPLENVQTSSQLNLNKYNK